MDIIDILILFVIFFNICVFFWLLDLLIINPMYLLLFNKGSLGPIIEPLYKLLQIISNNFPKISLTPYLLITIFFLIIYFIYLFIINVIPDTGIATLFIPVKELLLAIPPIPQLKNKGVFRFYDSLFTLFNFNQRLQTRLSNFSREYFYFSKDGTYEIMKLFNPHMNVNEIDNIIEEMNNNNKKKELRNLKTDVNICINTNTNLTTPDMNFTNIIGNNINDIKNTIKCNLKSIAPYISTDPDVDR